MSKKKRRSIAKRAGSKTRSYGRTAPVRTATPARKSAAAPAKIDLYKQHRSEYLASAMPSFVRVGPALYLAYDGRSASGATPEFGTGVGAIYAVAFAVKAAFKAAGKDYAVTKLEALWWRDDDSSPPTKDTVWSWRLLVRVPPFVTAAELASAQDALVARGKPDAVRHVQLVEMQEDTCVQILHVGSYQEEGPAIEKMRRFAEISGRAFAGKHHEIYLSDPNKAAGGKLRTILRRPVQ